ncbi:MAG: hypothetical protein LBR26_15760 [Prevotella sp.]|jgi:hypothetical protein|nr:hypothetical protein [Prevotella sp.]
MPVVLLLNYEIDGQNVISLVLSERFLYKQAWLEGEKVGKIITLKDISVDKPHAARIHILEGLKIGNDIRSFNDLHKFWQTKFSIQTLNDYKAKPVKTIIVTGRIGA